MKFYVDLDSLSLVSTPGYSAPVTNVYVRLRDTPTFEVYFISDGVVTDPGAISLSFKGRASGVYSGGATLVTNTSFSRRGNSTQLRYTATVDFSQAGLVTAVGSAENLTIYGEFSWTLSAVTTSARKFSIVVENDLV
jgi:hypothetical protein